MIRSARLAVSFLTRLPVPAPARVEPHELAAAGGWFGLVGALVGALGAAVLLLADAALPHGTAVVLALAAVALITGGLHEDGLADTADALGAHTSRERRLEIMRDPRVGALGALALGLVTLLSFATLAALPARTAAASLVAAHTLARLAPLAHALVLAPARPDGLGAAVRPRLAACVVAYAYSAALAVAVLGPVPALAAAAALLAVIAVLALVFRRTLGGLTGDTQGAATKLAEVAVYVAVAAVA